MLQAEGEVKVELAGLKQALWQCSRVEELLGSGSWQVRVELDQHLFLLLLAQLPVVYLCTVPVTILWLNVGEQRVQVFEVLELELAERVVTLLK